jgi:DNA-binding beta-propeller fold protein YncE
VMGGSDRDSAEVPAGLTADPACVRTPPLARTRNAMRRSVLTLCLLAGGVLLSSSSALASGGVEHVFGRTFKSAGTKCAFTEPGGVAVNEATTGEGAGDVFVFDRATNAIDIFTSTGECVLHHRFGKAKTGEAGNEGLAVDNSTGPSAGAIYAVEAEEHAIYKFKLQEGKISLVRKIKVFKRLEGKIVVEEFPEFEPVHGLAVDGTGSLYVDEGETFVDHFSGGEPNAFLSRTEAPGTCLPRPGFAIADSAVTKEPEAFYIGRERETRSSTCEEEAVLVKTNTAFEPVAEPARNAQLDNEATTGVAVDSASNVYFDNKTDVSSFNSAGLFVQRFGSTQLKEGAGVAVNSANENLYVADAHEGTVDVYIPGSAPQEPPPGPGGELPDHRGWELVTPSNKFGAGILPITLEEGVVQAAEDGSALTYSATAPIVPTPPANRSPEPASILSKRASSGWSTEGIATPRSEIPAGYQADSGTEYRFFSSDLSVGLVEPDLGIKAPNEPPLSPEATETTLYWRSLTTPTAACEPTPSSCYKALVSPLNDTAHSPFGAKLAFLSATPDGHHAVLKSDVALTPEAVEAEGLYETEPGGALQLVSVLPTGEPGTAAEAKLGARGSQSGDMRHAISNNGSRIVFSAEESKLYMRDMNTHETVRVDKAKGVAEPTEASAVFVSASTDGSKIFFTDSHGLTPNSTIGEGVEELEGGDLYVCNVVQEGGKLACHLEDLTSKEVAMPSSENAAVQGVPGVSDNGSYVYFVANGVLASQAGRGHCAFRSTQEEKEETEGKIPVQSCSLYMLHFNGTSWEKPKFIAALTTEDLHTWQLQTERGDLAPTSSRVSPNGQFFAFMSNRSLTGYNNVDIHSKIRDEEVFLYKAIGEKVICASCNPTGVQPSGVFDTEQSGEGLGLVIDRPKTWEGRWLAANVPGWTALSVERALYQSRYLSDTGRLYFNSADPLVPAAKNAGKADVYQYEAQGEGTCESPTGCVSLISSGTSAHESAFLDASVSGNDVFLFTSEKLAPQADKDTAFDIYDAHVCTSSSPCITPSEEKPPACVAEPSEATCKGPGTTVPALPGAPPSSLPGPGNAGTHEVLGEKTSVPPKPKSETRAQKLAKALKVCKKLKKKSKRVVCERQARKKYGTVATHHSKKGKK